MFRVLGLGLLGSRAFGHLGFRTFRVEGSGLLGAFRAFRV